MSRRSSTQRDVRVVEEEQVVQGRVFWLPPKESLPPRAVRRAHGKGAVEDGIYNHPVLVVSRPSCENNTVHFQIITSFQGKRLHEIYPKSNEFHASRRSWYLPISPSPDHPDASSKKARKRFPTLDLAGGAVFRYDSYLNIRHIYKIDWSYLTPYSNPDTPERQFFSFERESTVRLLAKSKILTAYEPGAQFSPYTQLQPSYTSPRLRTYRDSVGVELSRNEDAGNESLEYEPPSDTGCSNSSSGHSVSSLLLHSDFGTAHEDAHSNTARPPDEPPDKQSKWSFIRRNLWRLMVWPLVVLRIMLARIRSREHIPREQER